MSSAEGTIDWPSVASKFAWDGFVRDIAIRDCILDDWISLFRAFSALDGARLALPSGDYWTDPMSIFSDDRSRAILLSYGGVSLKCDIISPEVIEFDLDPREIRDQLSLDSLLRLMGVMASTLHKPILLTEEGDPDVVLIKVDPPPTGPAQES